MVDYILTKDENNLLEVIKELLYGELIDVEVSSSEKNITRALTRKQARLIDIIREGHQYLDSIKVHQGEPVQVSVRGNSGNLKFKKRLTLT